MAPSLQNIRRSHIREATQPVGPTQRSSDGKITRVDPGPVSAGQLKRRQELARLKQIRGSLEELILLADAQDRLPRTESGYIATRGAVRAEANQLLSQLRNVIGVKAPAKKPVAAEKPTAIKPAKAKASESKDSAKVQLRLSKALVRILIEFSKAGHSANRITERSLWKDPGIRDAAMILGITPPQLQKMVSSKAHTS